MKKITKRVLVGGDDWSIRKCSMGFSTFDLYENGGIYPQQRRKHAHMMSMEW